jgi:hypothetical protein
MGDSPLKNSKIKSITAMRGMNTGDKMHTNIHAINWICTCDHSIHSIKDYARLKLH